MINTWLSYNQRQPSPYGSFTIVDVSELGEPSEDVKNHIANTILESYRNINFYKIHFEHEPQQALLDYLDTYVFPGEDNNIVRNVKQGDYGEILAQLIVEYFCELEVPIHKMRHKFNKDRSVFCTDMIAHNSGEPLTDIYYYEVKTRRTMIRTDGHYPPVNAHNSLLNDQNGGTEGIADFLCRMYFERGDYDKSKKYGEVIKNPSAFIRHFELFFIIETDIYLEEIVEELNALPPTLTPLNVTVVLIRDLAQKLQDGFDRAKTQVITIVYPQS